ncbi:hypothetical protein D1872_277260 [compost metagenome]
MVRFQGQVHFFDKSVKTDQRHKIDLKKDPARSRQQEIESGAAEPVDFKVKQPTKGGVRFQNKEFFRQFQIAARSQVQPFIHVNGEAPYRKKHQINKMRSDVSFLPDD